jgi:predicted cupin superfamily sugar epimerase
MSNQSNNNQANEWINILNLKSHPEGGFYSETYRSNDQTILERFNKQNRSCSTAIYYLLKTPESPKSYFHRIKADEMWHFYNGLPLIIHVLDEEKSSHTKFILNNELNMNINARPQYLISYGKWFAAELMTENIEDKKMDYTLCGCICTPGFDFNDFECAKRSYLLEKFPNLKELIIRLTPSD